jgi:hypothetical protein
MIAFIHAPLPAVKEADLKRPCGLELRESILNHRLLDSHYAKLRAENIDELRRHKSKDSR